MTRDTVPGIMDMEYDYTAGQDNGRIAQSKDWISGEQVNYTYDSLQRLATAQTTGAQWGEAYSYDGFGNLTGKTPTQGSAPALSVSYNPATNQPYNGNYDANGNAPVGTWNVENRLVGQVLDGAQVGWSYDSFGKRVVRYQVVNGVPQWTFSIYDAGGRRAGQIMCTYGGTTCTIGEMETYFGGKLIAETDASGHVLGPVDRLGTVRGVGTNGTWAQPTYFPYGESRTAGGIDGKQQWATYVRDSTGSAQDYAGQRYYSNVTGRFNSPDPGGAATADRRNPGSWNRYAYVNGDPVNYNDPNGLLSCFLDGINVGCKGLLQPECNSEFMNLFAGTSLSPEVTDACGENNDMPLVEGGGSDYDPVDGLVPSKIKATYDCLTTRIVPGVGAVTERDVTYQAYWVDQFGSDHLLYGAVITEHLQVVAGQKPPESSATTSFVDTIAIGANGPFTVNQTFTVSFNGTTYSNLALYNAYGNAVADSKNQISANARTVSLNNSTAAKNGSCN